MRRDWQIVALLAAATIAVFWRVSRHEFVNYDDPAYVTFNPMVQRGLTWSGVAWAFGELHGEATYWHPLTWLSHMLDCQLFGLRPAGHHLVSLFLHTLNTVLLFILLRRMTGQRGRSAVVAALFGLHPLQVDSVAWVAERKNLLSTFFGLLTLWAYARYVEKSEGRRPKSAIRNPKSEGNPKAEIREAGGSRQEPALGNTQHVSGSTFHVSGFTQPASIFHLPSSIYYLLSFSFFALGLMSKPMLVTLPLVMLLLDYWPLGRLRLGTQNSKLKTLLALLLEKLPLLALSAASSVLTIRGHESLGALVSTEQLPVPLRLVNAVVACALYLRKLVWPVDLSVFYLHPGRWPAGAVVGSALVWVGLTALAVWQARRRPYLIVGWLWFLAMLLPVIGLVQAHVQALADRFAYLPIIGVLMMAVWAAADWTAGLTQGRRIQAGLTAVALASCVVMTSLQLRYWKDSIRLLQHAMQVQPESFMARVMLGNAFFERSQVEAALREYQAATRLRPDYPDAWERAGVVLTQQGKLADAIPCFRTAIQLAPGWPEPSRRLALALLRQGRSEEARAAYQQLAKLMPATAQGYRDLADMLNEGQQFAEAIHYYRESLRLKPDFGPVLNNLALLRAACEQPELRDVREAVELAERACQLSQRRDPNALGTLAAAYAQAGRFSEAVKTIQEAQAVAKASGADYLLRIQAEMLEKFRAGKPFR